MRRWPARRIHQEAATLTRGDALAALALLVRPADRTSIEGYVAGWSARLGGPCQGVASGRGAIVRALEASGIGPGDEVIVTGWTCVAVPAAVMALGARPRYADVDATGNVSVESVMATVGPSTRALIVQHTLGNPAPTARIRAELPERVWVVEDLAHAVGSSLDGHPVGRDGDWAIVSTEQSKVLHTGQGGVLAAISVRARDRPARPVPSDASRRLARRWLLRTGLERLAWALRIGDRDLAAQIADRALLRLGLARISSADDQELDGGVPRWRVADLDASLAELGRRQLARLDEIIDHRRSIAATYGTVLDGRVDGLERLPGAEPVWLRYPVLVDDAEEAARALRRLGWDMGGRWFSHPVYPPAHPETLGYVAGSCPTGEGLGRRVLNLPTHPLISSALATRLARDVLQVAGAARA